ncbi:unnamed protein product [Polarella glacialis]|uniref:Uncharacterized protein n=1 Tax=Polarella glacialis TaxID=89957 RepID=A0A813E8D1_POLGL|nr:unnamed protein product [Polarella glacialis]
MLNRDATRQLLPHLTKRFPCAAVERIDQFLGDNHLNVAAELRQVAEAKQAQIWSAFYAAEILPTAKKGFGWVAVRKEQGRKYFPLQLQDPVDTYVRDLARSQGLACEVAHGKGKGRKGCGSWLFSWGGDSPQVGKHPAAVELTRLASGAQKHRQRNVWAKFFTSKLLPIARIGRTKVEIDNVALQRFFNCSREDDFAKIARDKAVGCETTSSRRTGAKGRGKGLIHSYCFSWNNISLADGAILHEPCTGVELLKVVASARARFWEKFFQARLMPVAEEGLTSLHLVENEVIRWFPFVEKIIFDYHVEGLQTKVESFEELKTLVESTGVQMRYRPSAWVTMRSAFTFSW